MDKLYDNCCGIDVHKKLIAACFRKGSKQEVQEFGATTRELLNAAGWLENSGCEIIAMESTGSYWKPLYNILECDRSECAAYEGGTWTQDRCERCGMDC